jgi:integrase
MMSFAQSGSKAEANWVFGALARFILLTSARRGEAAELRWTELQGRDWTLPAARNKAKVDLVRPLSRAAFATLPPKLDGCDFVFSTNGRSDQRLQP